MFREAVSIRMPGRGITTEMFPVESFYMQSYRNIGISPEIFSNILRSAATLSRRERLVVITPSGAGAFLLSDLARRVGLDAGDVAEVSRKVIAAQASLIHEWIKQKTGLRCAFIDAPEELVELAGQVQVCVVKPSDRFASTDSLWASVSFISGARHAFNFKRLTASDHMVPDLLRTPAADLNLHWWEENARLWEAQGASPMFDFQALEYFVRSRCEMWILQPEHPEDMARIMDNRAPSGMARRILL